MRVAAVMAALMSMCGPVDQAKPVNSCPEWEPLLHVHNPGWDVPRMSRIMWRESRCQPAVQSKTSDTGLLQINRINHRWLSDRLGVEVNRHTLTDPVLNVQSAAALCVYWRRAANHCYQPWAVTDRGS